MMHSKTSPVQFLAGAASAALLTTAIVLWPSSASAQVIERGVQGALIGAGIGAITGGGKGAGKGALIGGAAGAVVGGVEKNRNRRRYDPPPERVYHSAPPPPRYSGASNFSRLTHDVQRELVRLGYDPGPIDGQYGRGTANAVSMYQQDYNLLVDGNISQALFKHMIQQGSQG